ncbi:hypothetical protein JW948_17105 [bacterium]|nr:hypothetical protein [bacterium]
MKKNMAVSGLLFIFIAGMLYGAKLYEDRIYEPVILLGDQIPAVRNAKLPVDEIFVYAYKNGGWHMMPFQIDERVRRADPDLSKDEATRIRHFYAIANTNTAYADPDTNAAFDGDDELVFLIRDLGDEAPANAVFGDAQAQANPKYKLTFTDPLTQEKTYAYIVRSATLTMPDDVKNKYAMSFDPATHTIQSISYTLGVSQVNGFLKDIIIKPPFGSNTDIFDTQKIRMNGFLDLAMGIPFEMGRNDGNSGTEVMFYVFPNETYLSYTDRPVVRVIREVRESLGNNKAGYPFEGTEFYIKTFFFPYSASFEGGALLDPDSLKAALDDPSLEIVIEMDYLRQSWDFNANAAGMQFYNKYNTAVPVDGLPDSPDMTVDKPASDERLQLWSMMTGNQGTFFNFFDLAESNWDALSLYYYDDQNGGQLDQAILVADDSGEPGCYGDHGVRFTNTVVQTKALNLDFSFTAYFDLPNQNRTRAEQLWSWIQNPPANPSVNTVEFSATGIKPNPSPDCFMLGQMAPNPFNMTTSFDFVLDRASDVHCFVLDATGKHVRDIEKRGFSAGRHALTWNGTSDDGTVLPSGLYVIRLETPEFQDQKKVILLK